MNKHRQMSLFLAIVESGSISKAAERLELSKSVLSSALKQLEQELDTVLLKRTTRKQSLTPQGERFYQHCLAMHAIADQAWDEIKQAQTTPSGSVTLTAPHALMESVVAPAVASTFVRYPEVRIELIADDHQLDLMQHNIDLAIRVGESADSSYRQRKIGAFRDVLCQANHSRDELSSAAYVANHWQRKHIHHTLQNQTSDEVKTFRFTASHRANTINQVATMVSLGLGVGIIPDFLIKQYPTLAPCLPDYELPLTNLYALHAYSQKPPIAVVMAIEAIQSKLREMKIGE
ncbi:LysR family transcriptional regulator [Vibrio sp. TBV020]|uniref:LysR family transcriptional regulator n=1 Tax=Vibrio sp. TBV020 TaxID=3137398 RepID=UPI0038CDC774